MNKHAMEAINKTICAKLGTCRIIKNIGCCPAEYKGVAPCDHMQISFTPAI